ncbi:MAG: hypothetical protein LC676_09230 [Loktanella sp.]|nr:hypothetical protein [Loktanella sp.]
MTMFSIKPKFDLAEFLATPAPVGKARSRNARRRKMLAQPAEKAEDTPKPSTPEGSKSTEKPE